MGNLQLGQCVLCKGTVDSVEDEVRGLIAAIIPERYGPDVIRSIPPLWPAYVEASVLPKDPIWFLEFPGNQIFWMSLAPIGNCASEAAVLYAPLKLILLAILDDLDKVKTHTHQPGQYIAPPFGGTLAMTSGAPVEDLSYGDARKDIEGDKPKSKKVRIVTDVPQNGGE